MNLFKKMMAIALSALLIFSAGLPINPTQAETAANTKISDIKTSDGKYKAATWAIDNDYMQLHAGNRFLPGTLVMEWQMLEMIAKLDKNYNFSYEKDTLYAYYEELNIPLYGVDNASKRNANISRGHFARLYAAMNGLDLSEVQAVQYLYLNEITTGTTGKRTFEDYKPSRNISRADMAVFMYRMNQQGGLALEGLTAAASGRDNNKVTLPKNFVENADSTVEIPLQPGKNTDDKVNRPDIYKAVKSINVSTEELTANGKDSSLISISLKDSYGNDISYDESLAFKVTSDAGAKFSETDSSTSGNTTVIYSDGPDLNVFVTAPTVTKSVVDTIRFEMIDPTDKYHTYRNQVIEASIRYVPKAEIRISYETYDPDQTEWSGSDIDPGVKPLPALPQGVAVNGGGASVPYTEGVITITDYDEDTKLLTGLKFENYTNPTTGELTQGEVQSDEIQYGNAELKILGQNISVWLFEQILEDIIYGEDDEQNWAGNDPAKVRYTVNSEGRATYELQGVLSDEHEDQFTETSTLHSVVVYLIEILPKADDITLAHEESVRAIKAIYDKLSKIDKDMLQRDFAQSIGQLEGAVSKIDILKTGQELENRPEGMERYTKVIVNLVLPSGVVVTDYKGTVEISFNGKTRLVAFDTNTKDYNEGTGHAGSAVAFFDDLIYGYSTVTAKLVDKDPRYVKALEGINNATVSKKIFTNQKFEANSCSLIAEVALLVDHSGSMKSRDRGNHTANKVKQMVTELQSDPTHVYRFSNEARHEATNEADEVATIESLLKYKRENASTNIGTSAETVIKNFSKTATSKVIVLITDGHTNKNRINSMKDLAEKNDVTIHTISVGKYNQVNESLLRALATDTDGMYFNIEDINNLHNPMQSIIKSILCAEVTTDNSCLVGDTLFNESKITIGRASVSMDARINQSCDNVSKVIVIFTANSGSFTYDLRGDKNTFKLSRRVTEFMQFNLYTDVEFQAFDKNGELITTKRVNP